MKHLYIQFSQDSMKKANCISNFIGEKIMALLVTESGTQKGGPPKSLRLAMTHSRHPKWLGEWMFFSVEEWRLLAPPQITSYKHLQMRWVLRSYVEWWPCSTAPTHTAPAWPWDCCLVTRSLSPTSSLSSSKHHVALKSGSQDLHLASLGSRHHSAGVYPWLH